MSFSCGNCGETQEDGTIPTLIVTERRDKIYPERSKDNTVVDKGGRGYETVREIQACEKCAILLKEEN